MLQKKEQVKEIFLDERLPFPELQARLPPDLCDDPPLLGDVEELCDVQFPLHYSYWYQNECIEHKDAAVIVFSLFTEAVGDVFREVVGLKKERYITEKLEKLEMFIDFPYKEQSFRDMMSVDSKKVLREQQQRVKDWLKVMKVDLPPEERLVPICEGQEYLAEVQEKSILLTQELLKWGLEEKSTPEMKAAIYNFTRQVRQLLGFSLVEE